MVGGDVLLADARAPRARATVPTSQPAQRLRPDRGRHHRDRAPRSSRRDARGRRPDRPADRQHRASTSSTGGCSRCRSACPASCTSAATRWPAATSAGRPLTAERFVPDPFGPAGRAPVPHRRPWRAGAPTAPSSSSAASTTRSRCAASASSRARSRRRWPRHPGVREARWWRADDGARRPAAGRLRGRPTATDAGELRAFLRAAAARLHGAGGLRALDALPLTAERQGGPPRPARPGAARAAGPRAWSRRATPAEEVLAGVWAEVLGLDAGRRARQLLRARRRLDPRASRSSRGPASRASSSRRASSSSTRPSPSWPPSPAPPRRSRPSRARQRARCR